MDRAHSNPQDEVIITLVQKIRKPPKPPPYSYNQQMRLASYAWYRRITETRFWLYHSY